MDVTHLDIIMYVMFTNCITQLPGTQCPLVFTLKLGEKYLKVKGKKKKNNSMYRIRVLLTELHSDNKLWRSTSNNEKLDCD